MRNRKGGSQMSESWLENAYVHSEVSGGDILIRILFVQLKLKQFLCLSKPLKAYLRTMTSYFIVWICHNLHRNLKIVNTSFLGFYFIFLAKKLSTEQFYWVIRIKIWYKLLLKNTSFLFFILLFINFFTFYRFYHKDKLGTGSNWAGERPCLAEEEISPSVITWSPKVILLNENQNLETYGSHCRIFFFHVIVFAK